MTCLDGRLFGRTLYCSLPLARILTKGELRAIIGHELGHYKGLDTKFSQRFYPIYRGTASSIAALQAAGQEGSRAIALLPAIAVLSFFYECFALAENAISRERELAADREGGNVTNKETIAAALVKVHAFSGLWENLTTAAEGALREGKMFVNASKTYADVVTDNVSLDSLEGLADRELSHPTDSHPPLGVRLEALRLRIQDVSSAALAVSPTDPAIALLPNPEATEEEISAAYQAILARQLGIDLGKAQEDKTGPGA